MELSMFKVKDHVLAKRSPEFGLAMGGVWPGYRWGKGYVTLLRDAPGPTYLWGAPNTSTRRQIRKIGLRPDDLVVRTLAAANLVEVVVVEDVDADLNDITDIEELREMAKAARRSHREDVGIIGTRLIEVADRDGYCETYDEVIDNINEQLTVRLPERGRQVCAYVQVVGHVEDRHVTLHVPKGGTLAEVAAAWAHGRYGVGAVVSHARACDG